ncbi:hypothetical protein H8E77_07985 [bacterium]|nr:hypothetical protein [bacterium]
MAKVTGVFTGYKGKVGNLVYAMWKGIQVAKTRSTPYNPQSPDQTVQRTVFALLVAIGRGILTDIIQVFWDPYVGSAISGWAQWMKKNLDNLSSAVMDYANMVFALGSLYATAITASTYTTGTGACVITFSNSSVNNQADTDKSYAIVFDAGTGLYYYNMSGSAARSTGTMTVTCPTGLTATDLEAYLWFSQGTAPDMVISNSQHATSVAP